jgi:hypothetical protein
LEDDMSTAVMWVERGHGATTTLLSVRLPAEAAELRQSLMDAGFHWDCGSLTTAAPHAAIADLLQWLHAAGIELLDNGLPGNAQLHSELGLQTNQTPNRTRIAWERAQAGYDPASRRAEAPRAPLWAWQIHDQHIWVWLLWLGALAGLLALAGVGR